MSGPADALRRPSRDLAQEYAKALAEQLPLIKRDGGFVRPGYRPELDEYIFPIHPTLSTGGDVFKGTADAVFQNLRMISSDTTEVLIVSGDHIYKMDYAKMVARHRASHSS